MTRCDITQIRNAEQSTHTLPTRVCMVTTVEANSGLTTPAAVTACPVDRTRTGRQSGWFSYDDADNLTAVTTQLGQFICYDADGNLTAVTDAERNRPTLATIGQQPGQVVD